MKNDNTPSWKKVKSTPTSLYSGKMQENWEFFQQILEDKKVTQKGVTKFIAIPTAFVDMLDYNYPAAVLLTQIVYWHLPQEESSKNAFTKLRVFKYGHYWLAKRRNEWWEDGIRLKPKQIDYALDLIEKKGFIIVKRFKFDGIPTQHIRLTEKFFDVFFKNELNLIGSFDEKKDKKSDTFTSGTSENWENPFPKKGGIYNIDYLTENTSSIYKYSGFLEKPGSISREKKETLNLNNQQEEFDVSTQHADSFLSAELRSSQRTEEARASQLTKEEGWELIIDTPISNEMLKSAGHNPYFFEAFERTRGMPYPWPQDKRNAEVLSKLDALGDSRIGEGQWVSDDEVKNLIDLYFLQEFREETDYRVYHFLQESVLMNLSEKIRCPEIMSVDHHNILYH